MNFILSVSCLLALAASIAADPVGGLMYAPAYSMHTHAEPRYTFEYSVKDPSTRDNHQHWEKREGDGVKGSYSLVEPGGAVRTVDYWADSKSGFNAVIRRDGPKVHPLSIRVAPIAKAPMFASGYGPMPYASMAPIVTKPAYGAISTAYVDKISVPSAVVPAVPIVASAMAPIAKQIFPAPIMPAPIMQDPILADPIIPAHMMTKLPPMPSDLHSHSHSHGHGYGDYTH